MSLVFLWLFVALVTCWNMWFAARLCDKLRELIDELKKIKKG